VGNLSSAITDDRLQELFSNKGFQLSSARVICDREGGRSRGFGFVEMASREEAERAIDEFHGSDFEGRALQVADALSRNARGGINTSAQNRTSATNGDRN
jgi:RNA recognition motif-containing protein